MLKQPHSLTQIIQTRTFFQALQQDGLSPSYRWEILTLFTSLLESVLIQFCTRKVCASLMHSSLCSSFSCRLLIRPMLSSTPIVWHCNSKIDDNQSVSLCSCSVGHGAVCTVLRRMKRIVNENGDQCWWGRNTWGMGLAVHTGACMWAAKPSPEYFHSLPQVNVNQRRCLTSFHITFSHLLATLSPWCCLYNVLWIWSNKHWTFGFWILWSGTSLQMHPCDNTVPNLPSLTLSLLGVCDAVSTMCAKFEAPSIWLEFKSNCMYSV